VAKDAFPGLLGSATAMPSDNKAPGRIAMSYGDADNRCVLVAEDEAIIGLDLSDELEQLGFNVVGPFMRNSAALAWLSKITPDLAILDVRLEDGTCLDLARELRRRGVPFVFFSGSGGLRSQMESEFPGAPWVAKPATLAHLLGAVQTTRRETR
jgi:DNA-binding response OmpR family regulator